MKLIQATASARGRRRRLGLSINDTLSISGSEYVYERE
jgi:hypothetical protein